MILITGANGFVGHKLMELYKDTAASPSLRNVTQEIVNRMIKESNADVVVHTAAISDIGTCEAEIPVMFGVVTTENIEQAIERAGTKAGNKGYDCALGAIEMINLVRQIG